MTRATRLVAVAHRLLESQDGDASDRVLLARFAHTRDERAFATLVERHGPLVLGASRRILNDASTADDVFQATFLVLARKASQGNWQPSIGPWLHAVAVRLARKARSRRTDTTLEIATAKALPAPSTDPTASLVWAEVKGALDEELSQLPTALSQPLVLCYLQGLTRDEAAGILGISLAELKRRLTRGRNLLRDQLSRRGLALAAAGWGIALMNPALSAEMRDRVMHLICHSTRSGTIPASLAELVASSPRTLMSRWVVASAVLTV